MKKQIITRATITSLTTATVQVGNETLDVEFSHMWFLTDASKAALKALLERQFKGRKTDSGFAMAGTVMFGMNIRLRTGWERYNKEYNEMTTKDCRALVKKYRPDAHCRANQNGSRVYYESDTKRTSLCPTTVQAWEQCWLMVSQAPDVLLKKED